MNVREQRFRCWLDDLFAQVDSVENASLDALMTVLPSTRAPCRFGSSFGQGERSMYFNGLQVLVRPELSVCTSD
ncbi:hypothetical protein FVE85_3439 [Porphyridium purpureum]|uniref:Uncharacterized protein n=1 Tax=Porphyridium purpureum TaxID=35688 RepID=A0A5J4YVH2_PORPP|nr:hypothetical protein FVE85_3439 [Porphyridium purpureum]|eukprot:POR7069..scf227_4